MRVVGRGRVSIVKVQATHIVLGDEPDWFCVLVLLS